MIKMLTLDKFDEWQTIVGQFNLHDIHYDARYLQLFQKHDEGDPRLIYFDNGQMQAMTVVLQRDLSDFWPFRELLQKRQYFDFTTVFGYCGFIFKGQVDKANLHALNQAYTEFCVNKRIVSEFVKRHPLHTAIYAEIETDILYKRKIVGHPIMMQLTTAQQIWEDLSSSRRRVIRKAQKAGVEIKWSNDTNLLKTFIPLYHSTMDRDQASDYFYFSDEFYQSIPDLLPYDMLFFYAQYDGEITAMAMMLFSNQTVQYFLSGSNSDFNHLSPTSLLIYEAALFAHSHGYKQFFLGGGQESLLKYKQGFNKHSDLNFEIGCKVFNPSVYDELLALRSLDSDFNSQSDFFPLYRA